MLNSSRPADGEFNHDRLLLIVVGAHLKAEITHRPLAYRMREHILKWIERAIVGTGNHPSPPVEPLDPVVCSDVWYLNNPDLLERPAIAIGAPGLNAATAYLATRLPVALVMDDALQIQMDVELATLQVCLWGVDQRSTQSAIDLFAERYLDAFLKKSHAQS